MTAVVFDHVVKQFGSFRAVDDVSLDIEAGEIFFLLGPSGCGKTTLLRCLAGFARPDSGRILLSGKDVSPIPPHQRNTGMVFQSYALWPHMTVRENVAFGLEQRRLERAEVRRRTEEALRLVRMDNRAEARTNQLSGGQQQRVALARALAVQPQCLLLDEPLSNLDAKLRQEMRTEIRRICKESGLTALYVTHDQKEALSIADRLAVLNEGRVEQVGRPEEVYRRPANRFVAGFIGDVNFLEGVVERVDRQNIQVRTAAGIWRACAEGAALSAGGPVTLAVRPENVRLDAPPSEAANVWEGRLSDTVYLGESAQHLLRLKSRDVSAESEVCLKVVEVRPARMAHENPAEEVRAWVAPEDIICLPEAGPTAGSFSK